MFKVWRRVLLVKGLVPFIKAKEIESLCQKLAQQITQDYKDLEPLLICPLKGSIFFLNQLVQYLDFPLDIDFISISHVHGVSRIRRDIAIPPQQRHVLIVEEIIDTGRRTNFLKERMLLTSPASLKIVSLLDKSSRRVVPVQVDYTGKSIDDRFVVGYGMDADELGRNYKDIYIFAQ